MITHDEFLIARQIGNNNSANLPSIHIKRHEIAVIKWQTRQFIRKGGVITRVAPDASVAFGKEWDAPDRELTEYRQSPEKVERDKMYRERWNYSISNKVEDKYNGRNGKK